MPRAITLKALWRKRTSSIKSCLPVIVTVGALSIAGCADKDSNERSLEALLGDGTRKPGETGIIEVAEPWISDCRQGCESAYLDFLSRHRDEGSTLSRKDLSESLERLQSEPAPLELELGRRALRQRVQEGLSIEFLLEDMDQRPLAVALLEETLRPQSIERRLLFGDPEVGSFEALLLLPRSAGPHAAVVGLHGHKDDAAIFAEDFLGRELVRLGFAVLIPEFRVHDCSRKENSIARKLLQGGFTLMGLRVYETLLMVKYLQHLEDVEASRLGLLGHSGGASVANLVARISDEFAAKVTDYQVDFRNRCGPTGIHCETLPDLFPLSADLTFEGELGMPFLEVPYKYQDPAVAAAIFTFFESALAEKR